MKFLFLVTTVLALCASTAISATAQTTMTWNIDGVERQALVFAPPPTTTAAVQHPLVFGFHGHGGTMQGAAQSMHIQTLWPEAIVVYPQGLNTKAAVIDPSGTRPGWQNQAGNDGDRDLKLFDAMLLTMHQKFTIDDERVYTTGFSAGGVFSYLLWAERSKQIAAVGECAGRLFDPEHLPEPRALLAIAGRADTTDLFALQQQTIETAKQVDSATGQGQTCGPNCMLYSSTTFTPVKTLIHPGGHVYPPWAPAQIVAFFKSHKRP